MKMSHIANQVLFKSEGREKKRKKIVTWLEILLEAVNCSYPPILGPLWKTFECLLWMGRDYFKTLEIQGVSFTFVRYSVIFPTEKQNNHIIYFASRK